MDKIEFKKKHLLLVDDETDILELLRYHFSQEGYIISCAVSGEEALKRVESDRPDLIILDILLPGMNGLEVLNALTRNPKTKHIPVLILSAKSDETDIITGLELGASDYITKPFSSKVLLARVRANLRSSTGKKDIQEILKFGDIAIYPRQYRVTVQDKPINVSAAEFGILEVLAKNPGWVFSRAKIADAIHSDDYSVTQRSVDVHIYGLRKKLGPARDCIETVWRAGYRFKVQNKTY
jgi:two-component system phosphate regulon response regulator PhoB